MSIESLKISIIIITYNQENLIQRALDSILCQKEFIFEIIISDDCSTDNTWNVIQNYKKQYSNIIKPYRHNKNVGIFGNIESTWNKPSGDIIFFLAGDDAFEKKLFENTHKLVKKNNINFKNNAFLVYFDYKNINPQGKESIISNSIVTKHNSFRLKIRRIITNRTMGMSSTVLKKHFPVKRKDGISALEEGMIDIQPHMFSDKCYYMPYVGSIYYSQIGVSSWLNKQDYLRTRIQFYDAVINMKEYVNSSDIRWLKYLKDKTLFISYPNLKNSYFKSLVLFSITNFNYGFTFICKEYKNYIYNMGKYLYSKFNKKLSFVIKK